MLRAIRERRGIKQKTVAAALRISPQAVSSWERGESAPSRDMVFALDAFYGESGEVLTIFGESGGVGPTNADLMAKLEEVARSVDELLALVRNSP